MALDRPLPLAHKEPAGAGVHLQGIRRVFSGQAVIDGLDLRIRPGEFLALLGPSGCGKSTLLRLIAGLDQPDAGRIVDNDPSRLSYVFQDASLMPWRTVLANVLLPLELTDGMDEDAVTCAMQLLETVGLAQAADRFPSELSGGMKMRVSLARALITRPRLLLLDEPFAALDEFTRQHLDQHLQQLWLDRRMTVIFVTHSITEAVFLADRVVVLSPKGGWVAADEPISLPRPRAQGSRTSTEFIGLVQRLSNALNGGTPME
jgi:NitT/TauT family transport system ATP-binding protein